MDSASRLSIRWPFSRISPDAIRPGVVSLPHGFGHDLEGVRLAVAKQHPGVSFNDLADELRTDGLCGTAAFSGTEVEIRA